MVSIRRMVVVVVKSAREVPSYLGNGELHPQDLNSLGRAVTLTGEASSDRGSSDEYEEVIEISCLLFLQRMRMKIKTWYM